MAKEETTHIMVKVTDKEELEKLRDKMELRSIASVLTKLLNKCGDKI